MTKKINPLLSKSESLSQSWKQRISYTDGLFGTPFYNSWRGIVFTMKGKNIGYEERWGKFIHFKEDMLPSYIAGHRLSRKDKSMPFSKENCSWIFPGDLNNRNVVMLEYNGQIKSLKAWCLEHDLAYNGVRQRYYKGKGYTPHEILFGIRYLPRRNLLDQATLDTKALRAKASKMIASHKCRDKKRGNDTCDMTIDWFIANILKKPCIYCGTLKYIGAERLDNKLPHVISNIVPACYRCNTVRKDHFTHEQMLKIGVFLRDAIDLPTAG